MFFDKRPYVNLLFVFAVFFLLQGTVVTYALVSTLKIPSLNNRPVIDEIGLIKPQEKQAITQLLFQLFQSGKAQMAVFVPASLQGYDIETFAMEVAEKWELGKKGVDQGLLLVIAPKERRMRLEVGYGLEGDITDAYSRRILDNVMLPYFRQGRYGEGIMLAIEAVAQKLKVDLSAPVSNRLASRRQSRSPLAKLLSGLLMLGFFFFFSFGRFFFFPMGMGGRRYGGGGFGGGGFGGFGGGGGGFGGGGASSSW